MADQFGGVPVDEDEFGGIAVDEEPTPLEPIKEIVPAVRMIGGEVVPGKPLDTHPDIIRREGLSAFDIDQRGFTAPGVPFMDRETAAAATGLPTRFEPGRLHSTDLIENQFPSAARIKSPDEVGKLLVPPSGEQRTTYGGPPKPVATLAETMAEPVEVLTTPRVTTPKFSVKERDSIPVTAGKEAVNLLSTIPEFLSSDVGLMALVSGAAAPTATAAAFTTDMLGNIGNQVLSTYKDWDKMTRNQKVAAITDIAGTGAMAALAARATAKGIRAKIAEKVAAPEVVPAEVPKPEPTPIIEAKPTAAPEPVFEEKPRTLTPAVRLDEDIQPGPDHGTARIAQARRLGKISTKPQDEIFIDENGNPLTRSQAATRFEEITGKKPNIPDALQSEDLKQANMLGKVEAAKPLEITTTDLFKDLPPSAKKTDIPIVIERADGTKYPAYFGGFQVIDKAGNHVPVIHRLVEGASGWSSGFGLKTGEKIVQGTIPETPSPKPWAPAAAPPTTTIPKLVSDVLARSDKDSNWVWMNASKAERASVDKWLVDTKHPMSMEPGTPESRFKRLVDEQSKLTTTPEPALVGMGGARAGEPAPGAQIEQLTQALKNVREKKAPIGEQVKESFALGRKYAAVKDALGQALAGMKTAGDTIISKWKGTEKIDDLLRAKGVLSRDIEARGWRLRQWEKEAYKAIPNPRDQAAIAKWVDAGGDLNNLQEGLNNAPAKYKQAYADAMELKGDKLIAAQNVQNYFESRLQEAIDAGVLDHGVENYLHRMYESKPDLLKRALAYTQTGLLKVNPSLAKKRVFQFDWEAEKLGYTPVQSFIKRITAYEASLSKAIAAREFIKKTTEMKAADGRPVVDIKGVGIPVEDATGVREATLIKPKFNASKNSEQFLPSGEPNPNYRGDYINRDYRALSRWKWASSDAAGKPIFVQGDVAIHPDYVGRIDALLQPSQVRYGKYGKVLRPALGASSVMKQTMLDLSGFHQVQITVHGMEHKVMPWKIIKEVDLANPNVDGLLKGGVTLGGDYSGAYKEGLVGNSLTRLIPGLGDVIESYHQWLFQDYIPRIKMTMALHALERNRARFGSTMSEEAIFRKTANQANSAFGELNYIMLERSKTAQDISRLILLAPDFLEARGRFAIQAFERGGKGIPGIGGNEQRMALLLGALTMYVTARIANKIVDGQYHNEPENLFNVVYDGHSYGLRTVQGDILHFLTKPLQFWTSRLNPVYGRTLLEALTGRDYFGRKRSPSEQAWDAVSTIVPISLRSSRERKLWESLLNGFGVTARRWSDVDDAFTLAKKWKDAHGVGERGEFIYDPQKDALRPLKLALNHGDEAGAAKEIKALLDSKAYTLKRLDTYFNRYAAMPFTGSRANDKKFIATLSSDQKRTIESARQHKIEIRKLYQKSKGQYLARPVAADSVTTDQFGGIPIE